MCREAPKITMRMRMKMKTMMMNPITRPNPPKSTVRAFLETMIPYPSLPRPANGQLQKAGHILQTTSEKSSNSTQPIKTTPNASVKSGGTNGNATR
jgi:hypothetical protein